MNDFDIFLWFRRTTNQVGTSSTQDQSAIMLTFDDKKGLLYETWPL